MRQPRPFALLVHALTPSVELKVAPKAFRFSCRGRVESIAPVLYLTGSGANQRVSAVGDSAAPPGPYTRVAFLQASAELELPISRTDALEAFLRYALAKVFKRTFLVRPTVFVSGIESIADTFGGTEARVLEDALLSVGAHRVVFFPLRAT